MLTKLTRWAIGADGDADGNVTWACPKTAVFKQPASLFLMVAGNGKVSLIELRKWVRFGSLHSSLIGRYPGYRGNN
jgi:hypothetical protein